MKPILLYFPGAGPPGDVAENLSRLFPSADVVGITYPSWQELTDPEQAMGNVLQQVDRQATARLSGREAVIVGYSLGAQIGWGYAHEIQRNGGTVAFFAAINGRFVAADKPDDQWMRRAVHRFASDLSNGDIRAAKAFISSRFSRLLQRAAGKSLPKMASRWAKRGRLPWFLTWNSDYETELNMRLLIRAAGPWSQSIESTLPPLECTSLLVRGPEDQAFDGCWRSLCTQLEIKAVTGSHLAILEPSQLQEVVQLITTAARESGVAL